MCRLRLVVRKCRAPGMGLLFTLASVPGLVIANPTGGQVIHGQATIRQQGDTLAVRQQSQTAIIDWRSFSIEASETTRFVQPDASSLAVNRVIGDDPSRIFGDLRANGRLMLLNQNGVHIGPSGRVDVAGLVVSTQDLSNERIRDGDFTFDAPTKPDARILNEGLISAKAGGLAALVSPNVVNHGVIRARQGTVSIGAGQRPTLDFYGDGLIQFETGDAGAAAPAAEPDPETGITPPTTLIDHSGSIQADGGVVQITARAAAEVVDRAINLDGRVQAQSLAQSGGRILLDAGHSEVRVNGALDVSAKSPTPLGERPGVTDPAPNQAPQPGAIRIQGERIFADGELNASGIDGGSIQIGATGWASAGGELNASGLRNGGAIDIQAEGISLAGTLEARGDLDRNAEGRGGAIEINSSVTTAYNTARLDASGAEGGRITHTAAQQITTSGHYAARGESGAGGEIALSASATKLLSPTLDASGETDGGSIRLGGARREPEANPNPEAIPTETAESRNGNAQTLVATDATVLDASSRGTQGDGGEVRLWSDQQTIFLGSVDVTPGMQSGQGGFVELSSAGELTWSGGQLEIGAGGELLIDPKDIEIVDLLSGGYSQYGLILGYNYPGSPIAAVGFDDYDDFGYSVSLDGANLTVGAPGDDGPGDALTNSGAVHLFTFADTSFTGGQLAATLGAGYTGGNNLDLSAQLGSLDRFGTSVSLDGLNLAAGAPYHNGFGNALSDSGAVHLFTFADTSFTGGQIKATLGAGYAGGNNLDLSAQLDPSDGFGSSVSLDGANLAVGAPYDDGFDNTLGISGAVHLFTFDPDFTNGSLAATLGAGYTGGNNIDLSAQLNMVDYFGRSVSLDGANLAVGASGDDGASDLFHTTGAVHLFTFADTVFTGGQIKATLGAGYAGVNDIDLSAQLDAAGDAFGFSVGLDGLNLAVGSVYDDGAGNALIDVGAVHLFTFADTDFTGGQIKATLGAGYTGGNNLDLSAQLDAYDWFGASVSLDGANLAVGAYGDDGAGNALTELGAVHLFSFTDTVFGGGQLEATLGADYTGGKNLDLSTRLDADDWFGSSVSLDGANLAVGSVYDAGFGDSLTDAGAVHLFTFADTSFTGGQLAATLGAGYTGGNNLDLSAQLDASDEFGRSVSLDGLNLAVGVPDDKGFGNLLNASGAVHLFTFADTNFTGGQIKATLGAGYNGGNNLDLSAQLNVGDWFGSSVSLDGPNLAVGGPGDDGLGNSLAVSGAVHLFTFADTSLTGGQLAATLGAGYTGGNNLDLSAQLEWNDQFGTSVSLDGLNLAAGSLYDYGFGNTLTESGAVRLFTFADTSFTGGQLAGTLGAGYTGGNNLDLSAQLDAYDEFGSSVSLDGLNLAVGARYDDGPGNSLDYSGAVHLFTFADTDFTGGQIKATLGAGYTGGNNLDLAAQLDAGDLFGVSVSLDGPNLAVGAMHDDGFGNSLTDSGAVYLFDLSNPAPTLGDWTFANTASGQIPAAEITALLNLGTAVTLQASNDLTLSTDLIANNPSGNGGALTLQAGRSMLLNGNLTTDNGALTLVANETLAAGVQDAFRDLGAAVFTMGAGTAIDAGTGSVSITLADGAGKTYSESGDITLQGITGGDLLVSNNGINPASNLVLNGPLSVTGAGDSLVLASKGDFINNSGAAALNPGAGRFVVYSTDPASNTLGGLTGEPWYNAGYPTDPPASIPAGTTPETGRFVYAIAPILTITADDQLKTYAAPNPALTHTVTGLLAGDAPAGALSGAPALSTLADATSPVGFYAITTALGDLASPYNYGFVLADGTLTIDPAALTVTALDDAKTYDGLAYSGGAGVTYAGFVNSETETVLGGALTYGGSAQGATDTGGYLITPGGLTAANYTIGFVDGVLAIDPAALSVTALDDAKTYDGLAYSGGNGVTYAGFVNSETEAALGGALTYGGSAQGATNAGGYLITPGGLSSGNYLISFADGALTIDQAPLAVSAADAVRLYGEPNSAIALSYTGFQNAEDASVLDVPPNTDTAADAASPVGSYALSISGGSDNNYYFATYADGTLTIDPAPLTVTALDAAKTYDGLAYSGGNGVSYTGFVNSETEAVLGGTLGYGGTAQGATNAGGYLITPQGLTASNYTIGFVDGTLTIDPAPLSVTALNDAKTYDGLAYSGGAGVTYAGFVNSETDAALGGALSYGGSAQGATNVGGYLITPAGLTSTNYTISFANGALTIDPAPLTITAVADGKTYDGLAYSGGNGVNYTGFVSGETDAVLGGTLTYSGDSQGAVDAGSYTITPAGFSSSNYTISFVDGALTIAQAPLSVSAADATRLYGEPNSAIVLSYTGFQNGEDAGVLDVPPVTDTLADQTSPVGDYALTISGGSDNNYFFNSYTDGTLTIDPAALTIDALNDAKTYDGQPYSGGPGVTYSGFVNGESNTVLGGTLAYSGTAQGAIDAGGYLITPEGLTATNYVITFTDGALTIDPAALTVTAQADAKTYDGLGYSGGNGVTYTGFAGSDSETDLGGSLSYGGDSQGATDAGSYLITAAGLTSANYDIRFAGGALSITPAPLTVSTSDVVKTYDGTTAAAGTPAVTSGTLYGTDNLSGGTFAFTGPNAGTGKTVTVSAVTVNDGNGGANYSLTLVDNTNSTINPRDIALEADPIAKGYGSPDPALSVSIAGGSLGGSDILADVIGALSREPGEDVGVYDVYLGSGAKTGNYSITYTVDNNAFSIDPAALSIALAADAVSKIYGEADPALSVSITGGALEGGDTLDEVIGTLSRESGEDVGAYDVYLGSGAKTGNYSVSYTVDNNAFTIDPAALTVTALDDQKTYDGLAYSGGNGVAYSGFVNGETEAVLGGTLTYAGSSQGALDAGDYRITPTGVTASNYNVTFADGTLTIEPAPLTVTALDDAKTYDGLAYSGGAGVTYAGFVNSETETVLGGALTYAGASQGAVDAGSYAITPAGLNATNYDISFFDGVLTVDTAQPPIEPAPPIEPEPPIEPAPPREPPGESMIDFTPEEDLMDLPATPHDQRAAGDSELMTFDSSEGIPAGTTESPFQAADAEPLQQAQSVLEQADVGAAPLGVQNETQQAQVLLDQYGLDQIEGYFGESLLPSDDKPFDPKQLDGHTAILYPLLLEDRITLTLLSAQGTFRVDVPVNRAELGEVIASYREQLQIRQNNRYLYSARQLYDWLIRPLEGQLAAWAIDTLAVAPQGPLRTVPLAALNDGERFLIERYALAVTPSLKLYPPRAADWGLRRVLAAGISESVQGFTPLPHVPQELSQVADLSGGVVLLDREYGLSDLKRVLENGAFEAVHLATHAQFTGNPKENFLLTYDTKLSLDLLEELIGAHRDSGKTLELLSISACQSALGDEGAALGLAGTAVKVGARAALGTLWFVDDAATAQAMTRFYEELFNNLAENKAKALQTAQKAMLKDARFQHPLYWAPFLLIGNWM